MTRPSVFHSLLDRDYFIWTIASLLSISVCSILFVLRQNKLNAAPAILIQETVTHVSFSTLAPPPVAMIQPKVEEPRPEPQKVEKIIPPEPVQKKPQPRVTKEIKPKTNPKPKPKKKKKPVPKVKKNKPKPPVKAIKPVRKQKTVSQNINPTTQKIVKPSPVVSTADPLLIKKTRISYQALLMRHIEVHKYYPRSARKRKIQGKVLVSFSLLKDGQIKNLSINGKRSILKKASQKAVNQALPMPAPPKNIPLPMEVKFHMDYFLK
ncbi:MAG: TonB family protein [gamma proteobacterium symbiont of Taylorina sp.]|nr:TonB family protein [gamma proteobacterium symbiont of Taylorina sp.]